MNKVYLSIIIITYGNPTIFDCLDALQKQIDNPDEIIVVDDFFSSAYYETLHTYCVNSRISLISSSKHGNRAYNRNVGAKAAHNPILLFIDADMLLSRMSISVIKKAYLSKDNVAYIGMRAAGRYDPLRMELLTGIDVQTIINQLDDIDFLSKLPSIQDNRTHPDTYAENLSEQKYYWIYYYSCCCTVSRKLFNEIGGFDEGFVGWGVEDVELGYRISLHGKISFLRDFYGIHVPHIRDVLYAEQDNCRNLKRFLYKFQRLDVEIVSTYRISAKLIDEVDHMFNRIRMLKLKHLSEKVKNDVVYINCISIDSPFGQLVYYDSNGQKNTYTLIGLSTFFKDQSIQTVYVSSNILIYPTSVICGIFQEALRIGKKVILCGDVPQNRLEWSDFPKLTLLQPQRRNMYRIQDIMEIDFEKISDMPEYRITSRFLEIESPREVPKRLHLSQTVHKELQLRDFCVINLAPGTGYRIILKQMEQELNSHFLGIYSVDTNYDLANHYNTFPEYLVSLLELKTAILLIVENIASFSLNLEAWTKRSHNGDIIIDYNGNYLLY